MCLTPRNLLDLQMLLEVLSLKKVSKKRKVSKASSRDGGGGLPSRTSLFSRTSRMRGVILFARVSNQDATEPGGSVLVWMN
jgi:hypothetical protein